MHRTNISQVLKADLMTGKSKYIHESYISFNRLEIKKKNNEFVIGFYYDDELLITMKQEFISVMDTLNFKLVDGQMKIELICA
jgi:hypothetical protein